MKKILKVIWIFLLLNILTLIIALFFWDFIIWTFTIENKYINPLIFYWVWLFLILINIFLINSYIRKFTSKKILIIASIIITIIFSSYIAINWNNHNLSKESELFYDFDDFNYNYITNEISIKKAHMPWYITIRVDRWTADLKDWYSVEKINDIDDWFLYWTWINWNTKIEKDFKTDIETWKTY